MKFLSMLRRYLNRLTFIFALEWNIIESSNGLVCKNVHVGIPMDADKVSGEFCTIRTHLDVKLTEWRQEDIRCELRCSEILTSFIF
jgi:hypothetical protein